VSRLLSCSFVTLNNKQKDFTSDCDNLKGKLSDKNLMVILLLKFNKIFATYILHYAELQFILLTL